MQEEPVDDEHGAKRDPLERGVDRGLGVDVVRRAADSPGTARSQR